MFKNFFPSKILLLKNKVINSLVVLLAIVLVIGLTYSLLISPPDYIQGDSVRIMYVHVPSSFIALGCFGFIGIASICNLIFKIKFMPFIAKSLAPIGCVFSLVSIVTGSFWGKPTWGTWWVWDARLTSVAILFIIYLIIIIINFSFENRNIREKIVAVFVIIGSINLPIIKFSVDWWNTLHQPASISKLSSPSIDPSMLRPLLIMTVAFMLIGLLIALIRIKSEILSRKNSI